MHDYEDEDEDPDFAFALEALSTAEKLVRNAAYLCVQAVERPSLPQLQVVAAFFPDAEPNQLRRDLASGRVRIGPFLPGAVLDFAYQALRGAGLSWRVEPPSDQDLARLGLVPH